MYAIMSTIMSSVQGSVVGLHGVPIILSALQAHPTHAIIAGTALAVLLELVQAGFQSVVASSDGIEVVLTAIRSNFTPSSNSPHAHSTHAIIGLGLLRALADGHAGNQVRMRSPGAC
jgi:hypothetical protein